jgi:hypothetical protein
MEDRQERIKQFAEAKKGQRVSFVEGSGLDIRVGRVVGYYYSMSQVIVEVDFRPKYSIDLPYSHVTVIADLDNNLFHCMVGWEELRGGELPKDPKNPHKCPRCGSQCMQLYWQVECTNPACPCYKKP